MKVLYRLCREWHFGHFQSSEAKETIKFWRLALPTPSDGMAKGENLLWLAHQNVLPVLKLEERGISNFETLRFFFKSETLVSFPNFVEVLNILWLTCYNVWKTVMVFKLRNLVSYFSLYLNSNKSEVYHKMLQTKLVASTMM